jgi:MFS family permease
MKVADAAARNIKVLSWFNLLMDFRFYGPVAVLVFQRICGSYALAMAVFGAAMLSAVVFELPTGILSDRVGRRFTLILGQAAGFLSVLSYAIAGSIGEGGAAALFIGAGLEGLARAFFSGNNNALIHDSLKASGREEEFHRVLGKLSSYFQVAAALCALAGSSIAQASFALVLWLSVIPQAAALALSFAVIEPELGKPKGAGEEVFSSMRHFLLAMKAFFGNRRLVAVGIANSVSNALGESAYQFSAAFFASLWPIWAIGFSKTLSSVGAAVSYRISGRAIDRFGAFPVLIASRAYGRVAGIAASAFPGPWSPVVSSSSSLFFGSAMVASETIMQREYTDGQRATMGSIGSILEGIAFAAASPLLGVLADRIGAVNAFFWIQIAMIPTVVALWLEHRRPRAKAEPPAAH